MKKLIYAGTLLIFVCMTTACGQDFAFPQIVNNSKATLNDMTCYKTFEEFAYTNFIQSSEKWLPTEPWQIQAKMPNKYLGDSAYWDVQLVRYVNDDPEIWFRGWSGNKNDDTNILIYHPHSRRWTPISDVVEKSDISVQELYLTKDGTVWGRNYWNKERKNTPDRGSILSKYNEQTNQFEFVPEVFQVPFANEEKYSSTNVLFDDVNNVFWIGIEPDGLYTYDPNIDKTTKQASLQNMSVGTLGSATDGTIFFTNLIEEPEYPSFAPENLYEGFLMRFSPEGNEFIALEVPDKPWPKLGLPIVTKSDFLWIGAVGYLDLNNNRWNLLVEPSDYYVGGYLSWPTSPYVILEDGSGIVWFRLASEQRGGGMAWLDPKTGEGCMFTNIPAKIVEDDRQQLWMFADGKLYRYALE